MRSKTAVSWDVSGPGSNTFLCTEQAYRNFIFRTQVKLDVPGNSGLQLRSHQRNGAGRVFGYQVEIDPSPRGWSGGIYDEGRRGWLASLEEDAQARAAFRRDDWNQYEVRAIGPWIRTWVNGVPCADLIDTMDDEGFLALQVHAGQSGQIRWREIQLTPLPDTPWQPLWNGTDLAGWEAMGGGQWTIEDGVLHGVSAAAEPRHGHLITTNQYKDFAVRLQYKAIQGNSGLYFRVEPGGDAGVLGFQAEIDPQRDAGGLYETGGRAWVVQPKPEDVARWFRPGEWNSMAVVAIGDRIVVQVNGQTSAQLRHDPGRRQGQIALQLHGGQDMDVMFKDIQIMSLDHILDSLAEQE